MYEVNYIVHLALYSSCKTVSVGAGAVLDILGIFGIMYLTREPEGECESPDPAKVNSSYKSIAVPKL